ncbi:MAG: hypothetical protein JSS58_01345, partial [Proteobacteria bacterium]|nr:hypothetical protein [Pseudomonadota bacterium]
METNMLHEKLMKQLDAIEAELYKLGFHAEKAKEPVSVRSAFGMNEMPFEYWLTS